VIEVSADARLASPGSDATFGGTQCRQISCRDARLASPGSDATFGGTHCTEEHQWTQCRQISCRDARLAKIMPGRNARFAGMKNRSKIRRKAAFGRRRGRLRREVRLGSTSQEVMPPSVGRIALRSISGRNAGKYRAGTQGWQRSCRDAMPASRG